MKNILLLFAICFTFFIFPKITYSAVPTSIPTMPPMPKGIVGDTFTMPGVQCGDYMGDEDQKKCCYNKPITAPDANVFKGRPIWKRIVEPLTEFMKNASSDILNVDQIQSYTVPCINGTPSTLDPLDPNCVCEKPEEAKLSALEPLCDNISDTNEQDNCLVCLHGSPTSNVGVWTGVGCIYANTQSFIEETVFKWGIGLAGTIALLCIIYSAFQIQISQGNPEKLKKAQEMLTSCIIGLMLLIFSVFILKVIGVDIIKIPFDIF